MVRVRRGDSLVDECLDSLVHLRHELNLATSRSRHKEMGAAHVHRVELLIIARFRREPLRLALSDHLARLSSLAPGESFGPSHRGGAGKQRR